MSIWIMLAMRWWNYQLLLLYLHYITWFNFISCYSYSFIYFNIYLYIIITYIESYTLIMYYYFCPLSTFPYNFQLSIAKGIMIIVFFFLIFRSCSSKTKTVYLWRSQHTIVKCIYAIRNDNNTDNTDSY